MLLRGFAHLVRDEVALVGYGHLNLSFINKIWHMVSNI